MNEEQKRKELRKWAIEQALKLEYPISDFKSKEKAKTAIEALFLNHYEKRDQAILVVAYKIYSFVEEYENTGLLSYISNTTKNKVE